MKPTSKRPLTVSKSAPAKKKRKQEIKKDNEKGYNGNAEEDLLSALFNKMLNVKGRRKLTNQQR